MKNNIDHQPHPGLIDLTLHELELLERRKNARISVKPPNFLDKIKMNKKPKKTKKKVLNWRGSKFF